MGGVVASSYATTGGTLTAIGGALPLLLDYTPDDLIGHNWKQAWPKGYGITQELMAAHIEYGRAGVFRHPMLARDGDRYHIRTYLWPLHSRGTYLSRTVLEAVEARRHTVVLKGLLTWIAVCVNGVS